MSFPVDVDMPFMSGYEFINAVRKLHPHTRVLIATGSPDIPALDDSACFYLVKPFDLKKLKRIFQVISLCNNNEPSPDILKRTSIDDRNDFCVKCWECLRHSGCHSQ